MMQPNVQKKGKLRKGKGVWKGGKMFFELNDGEFGLKALERGRVRARQLEAGRRVLRRRLSRAGKVWISVFPQIGVTGKGLNQRIGKGKGRVDYYCANVHAGTILYEVRGVDWITAKKALEGVQGKLGRQTVLVERREGVEV